MRPSRIAVLTLGLLLVEGPVLFGDCREWQPFGGAIAGQDSAVIAFVAWDRDGVGPFPPDLVVGGRFTSVDGVAANNIAQWDGSHWNPLGDGLVHSSLLPDGVYSLATWDADGTGPIESQLIAGGNFSTSGTMAVSNIARWDGSAWLPCGSGMNGIVLAITSWDSDGSGPLSAQLVAAGQFSSAGGATANNIARWNGAVWQPLGSGTSDIVYALTNWDPDGPGPSSSYLVAGGRFSVAGGVSVNGIAAWDGSTWRPFGTGMNHDVYALSTWDPDGSGPLAETVVAGGRFTIAGGHKANGVARWESFSWQPFGVGIEGGPAPSVLAIATCDVGGQDQLAKQLFIGGRFTEASGSGVNNIAQWNGAMWQPLATGVDDWILALTTWNHQSSLSAGQQIVAGGIFLHSSGVPTQKLSTWLRRLVVGDTNSDDQVDAADLSVLLSQFGTGVAPGVGADFNHDGVVNGADLSILLSRFGSSC